LTRRDVFFGSFTSRRLLLNYVPADYDGAECQVRGDTSRRYRSC